MKDYSNYIADMIKRTALNTGVKPGGVPTIFNFSVFKESTNSEAELVRNIAMVIEATFPGMGNPYLWAPSNYDVVIRTQDKMGEYDATLFTEQALNRACGNLGLERQEKTPYRDYGVLVVLNHFKITGYISGLVSRIEGVLKQSPCYRFWGSTCSCRSVIEVMVKAGLLGLDGSDYTTSKSVYLTELGREVLKLYGNSIAEATTVTDLIKSAAFFKLKRYWAEAVARQIIEDSKGPLLYSVENRALERKSRKSSSSLMPRLKTPRYIKLSNKPKIPEVEIKHDKPNPPKPELEPQLESQLKPQLEPQLEPQPGMAMPIKIVQPVEIPRPTEPVEMENAVIAPLLPKGSIVPKHLELGPQIEPDTIYPSIFKREDIQDVVLKLTMLQLKCESEGQPGKADVISNMIKFLMKG